MPTTTDPMFKVLGMFNETTHFARLTLDNPAEATIEEWIVNIVKGTDAKIAKLIEERNEALEKAFNNLCD